jgi:Flp pilus assembly protein TadD
MMKLRLWGNLCLLTLLAACTTPDSSGLTARDEPRLRVARAAAASGDLALAESVGASASAAAPSDAAIQLEYADTLVRLNKIDQARSVLVSHLKTVRDPRLLHGPLGAIYVLQGEAAAALTELDAASEGDRSNMRWVVDKGIALDLLGRHADAQALYRECLAADPDDAIATTDLALSLALSGHKAEAAKLASTLAGRSDLPTRVTCTFDVLRAANGEDINPAREAFGSDYDRALQLAKAMDTTIAK